MAHHMTEDVKGGGVLVGAGDPLPIEYEPGLERDPELLVAVLSRGIAHWHCAGFEEPPGGEECFHYAVDLVWVLSGFGVFASKDLQRRHGSRLAALRTVAPGLGPYRRSWLCARFASARAELRGTDPLALPVPGVQ